MIEHLWLVPLGLAAGILGSIIGIGGGIVMVPVLTFMGFPPTLAASNSLFGAFGNAAASTLAYHKQGRIDYRTGLTLGMMSVPGTILGAYASAGVTPDAFKALFGTVLVASAAYILLRHKMGKKFSITAGPIMALAAGASFTAGIISSFFGIGGGVIFVPLMVVMGLGMLRAAPTSQLVLLFTSLAGLVTHAALGHPDLYQALLLASGAFAGGILGARLSLELGEGALRLLACTVIVAAAAKLFADSLDVSWSILD